MKEGDPAEQFHIQEERRLFHVALTRARERLTITTLTEKKGKVPTFVEDLVMDPEVKRRNVVQLAPKMAPRAAADENAGERGFGFALPCSQPIRREFFRALRIGRRTFHPPSQEPLKLSRFGAG